MAQIKIYDKGTTYFSAKLTGLQNVSYERKCQWTVFEKSSYNTMATGTTYIDAGSEEGGYCSFSGLISNTTYVVNCYITRTDTGGYLTSLSTETSTDGSGGGGSGGTQIYVSPWDWAISNGSASAEQTQTASNSATKGGVVSGFSYLVWNDMVDKVKAILDATNDVWDSRYADYEATKMTPEDRKLTAKRFNSLRYNIGIETGIGEVAKGDIVYRSYFRTLASKISFWIYELNGEVVH
jgi:hypothetical protein